ncbi:UPF0187 protein [Porphyridium purpureum]|uniref:UPF0187 protein n=1 Tax=Porphyridium purpureum TaxID=35688 RepID=A0A5J4YR29_PORPP|nr:UPF0187 protein [Porphyridium purpureum]|eukprot:POR9179..scf236_6
MAFVGCAGAGLRAQTARAQLASTSSALVIGAGAVVAAPRRVRRQSALSMAITRPERYKSTDWIKSLATIPKSSILRRIQSHILANVAFAGIVFALHEMYPNIDIWSISPLPHTVLGTVMGLLLVFRTNSAYDRFWEGRKIWGGIVNRTRSLGVNYMNYLGPINDSPNPEVSKILIKLDQAFPISLANHLRGELEPNAALEKLIPKQNWQEYVVARNRPLLVCRLQSRYIAQAYATREERDGNTNAERETMERGINDLIDYMGMCERIVKTPVPEAYSRHTSRFLSLWCLTLPFIFVKADDWLVMPIMAFVSFALFSIEEIGHLIEDPFIKHPYAPGIDLPLEAMATTINGDLQDMITTVDQQLEALAALPPPAAPAEPSVPTMKFGAKSPADATLPPPIASVKSAGWNTNRNI